MPTEVDAHQFKVLSKDVQTCTDKVKKLTLLEDLSDVPWGISSGAFGR